MQESDNNSETDTVSTGSSYVDTDDELDMSWKTSHEKLQSIEREPVLETMDSITCHCIYMNDENCLAHIDSCSIDLEKKDGDLYAGSHIYKETLLKIIEEHKRVKAYRGKYKLFDILLFHIGTKPEDIQAFAKSKDISGQYLSTLSVMNDVFIPPSIFPFHEINTLYFIFKESSIYKGNRQTKRIKSILKTENSKDIREHGSQNATKKVRISAINTYHSPKNRHKKYRFTRRRR